MNLATSALWALAAVGLLLLFGFAPPLAIFCGVCALVFSETNQERS